jgi:hypothetical protein
MQKRKHHYIPIFYLENFTCIPDDSIQKPYIYVFERGKKEPYRKAPKNVAAETDFYDVEGLDSKLSSVVEDLLSQLESLSSKVLKKILDRQLLTRDDRHLFAMFIISLRVRIPHFRSSFGQVIEDLARRFMMMSASQPGYLEEYLREREARTGEKIEIDIEEWRKSIMAEDSPYEISANPGFIMRAMLDAIANEEISQVLTDMRWNFLIAPENSYFVTSDFPIVVVDPPNRTQGAGFKSSPSVQLSFPLASTMCLLATWSKKKDGYVETTQELLKEINYRTYSYCTKYVFSSSDTLQLPKG